MPFRRFAAVFIVLVTSQLGTLMSARAQFWGALPALNSENSSCLCFSQDEKSVFYLSSESGVRNIFRASAKVAPPVQITKFTDAPIVRLFHAVGRPLLIFMRGKSPTDTDYHIYSVKEDGTGDIQDLTPTGVGVQNTIIGASYNGRYVYYTANKERITKLDCYRYDVQQNISALVFPNDKDYRVLAWSRDHGKLLIEDPASWALTLYDIVTTEIQKLAQPAAGSIYLQALLTTDSKGLIVLEAPQSSTNVVMKSVPIGSSDWKTDPTANVAHIDFSTNGKYEIIAIQHSVADPKNAPMHDAVIDLTTNQPVPLMDGAADVSVAPKETLVGFVVPGDASNHYKLELYDTVKKTTTELAMIK